MMSFLQAIPPSETMLGIPFSDFESGFTPWDSLDCFTPFDQLLEPEPISMAMSIPSPDEAGKSDNSSDRSRYHAGLASGSDGPNLNPVTSNNDSEALNQNHANTNFSSITDERKQRRMESNRASARRSRMRKKKHLENLREQVNRLKLENRESKNRLRFVVHLCECVQIENDRLRAESVVLQRTLKETGRILQFRQLQQSSSAWPCNNFTSIH
ncbi:hypothetical protein Nepgr_008184 [Nepenthes gracilis]|uniref:BZIP domain-containing protein n=1 Tax=Nepenthes gracilis TaxID=150966 RepID=A0AAD3XJ14_NEPGR|nr:hypothetical protein Nepgr_008184 [Nepenthes gracilis]